MSVKPCVEKQCCPLCSHFASQTAVVRTAYILEVKRNSTVLDTRGHTSTGQTTPVSFAFHMPLIFKARVEVGSVPLKSVCPGRGRPARTCELAVKQLKLLFLLER